MRRAVLGVAAGIWVWAGLALAGGIATSHRLESGVVALTNTQANSSWVPVAALVRFDAGTNGTMVVKRISQGNSFILGSCTFDHTTNLVWVADLAISFGFGDALVIESTATNGVVQVMRRSE